MTIPVYLVAKDCLLKEGVKSLLDGAEFSISAESEAVDGLPAIETAVPMSGMIVNIDSSLGNLTERVHQIRTRYPDNRIVIIGARREIPAVTEAFAAGLDGYILKDISAAGLVGSLRLVMTGEKVYPTSVLSFLRPAPEAMPANDENRDDGAKGHPLSRRELKIICHLAYGEPNKVIARRLNITEATVKVHVKTILRKLGAANRTQAAIWAISNGLGSGALPALPLPIRSSQA